MLQISVFSPITEKCGPEKASNLDTFHKVFVFPFSRYNLDTCKEGSYFFNNTKCVPCSVGFYKESASFKECTACPPGKTTNNTGATKKTDCSG